MGLRMEYRVRGVKELRGKSVDHCCREIYQRSFVEIAQYDPALNTVIDNETQYEPLRKTGV